MVKVEVAAVYVPVRAMAAEPAGLRLPVAGEPAVSESVPDCVPVANTAWYVGVVVGVELVGASALEQPKAPSPSSTTAIRRGNSTTDIERSS
jgi:hypothetical protein